MKRIVEDAGRCELCGSTRGLEAHHIIPVCAGGEDTEENLICVCNVCHGKLTPKSMLIKLGQRQRRNIRLELYSHIEKHCEANGYCLESVFDALDSFEEGA